MPFFQKKCKMTEELKDYYNTLLLKDNAQSKYYFDVIGLTEGGRSGQAAINYPVVSVLQNRRNATGAETFKNAIEQLERNKTVVAVLVKEYNSVADDAEPITENTFNLKPQKKMKKQQGKQPMTPQPQGLGTIDQTLQNFGNTLGLMGFENGLKGIITATASQIVQQDKLQDAQLTIAELKDEKKELEKEVQRLKGLNDGLKDEQRKLEYKIQDLERDNKRNEEVWAQKNSLGSLAANAFFGILGKSVKLNERLAGLLDDEPAAQQQPPQPSAQSQDSGDNALNSIQFANPETAEFIEQINGYLQTLDKSHIAIVTAICQYISVGDEQLKDVYGYVLSKKNNVNVNVEP